ncbi:structural maintenance of chromosomes protein 3-like [Nicotiana tomentosiformis]|uniref:structural maintenance of chromosomes protein 3-like n=1 Tax=Nicotiana tomentosiformis TaxID=4098 RepID=UPI00388C4B32
MGTRIEDGCADQTLRDEEGEDADCLLVARKRESVEASITAEPATTLHREASSKYRAELARCAADLKNLTKERNALKLLYVQKKEEIVQQKAELVEQLREEAKMKEADTLGWKQNMDRLASEKEMVRAQLSSVERQLQSVKEENFALAQKVEELKTRLAAELARAISEVEVLVASYRADAEAAKTRTKEIYDAAKVRLSHVAEHAKRQSLREILEKVCARGFDLTADIENAKVLEDEAGALFSMRKTL